MYDLHTAGEGVNSTTKQCVHVQSHSGKCLFPMFTLLPMDHLCTNRLLKQKNTQSLKHMKH